MKTNELLNIYYQGLAKKNGWETALSEDFKFIGGDMTKQEPVVGKHSYIEVINRFGKLFTDVRPVKMFVHGDEAFVLANYDYNFPNGKSINANVAELWKVHDGKLESLTIFFDTAGFNSFLK